MEISIILLGILSGGDFFGYEIMKIIKSVMVDIADVTTGTLYYKLKGLEKKGLLRSAREQEGLRPQRLRYSITAAGRKEFRRQAMQNITAAKRPYWPCLSSLFFVQYLPADEAARAVRRHGNDKRETLARLQATRKLLAGAPCPFHTDLLLEHGQQHLEVDIKWLEKFARALDRKSAGRDDARYSRKAWETYMALLPSPARRKE